VLLQNGDLPEQVTEDLHLLMEQTRRITKISQDLLFFSRQRPPERRAVDVNEIVRRTFDLMAYEFKLSNISVELELAEELPELQADQDHLQQVVLNLLSNARDAMGDGGRLVVATKEAPALWKSEETSVELRVEDSGPGIPPEHMDKIFEPFFTTKAEGQGTGMGLSICHGIIESHGGRLWAENRPDGGTAFIIHLPLGHDADSAP
jgi:two-component system NtrC family sensor kinase